MTIRSAHHPVDSRHTAKLRWERVKVVKAILGDVECAVGPVALAPPIKLPLRVFQQIIDEHRAGKKSRI